MDHKNSRIKDHPNFESKATVFMAVFFIVDAMLFAACFYLDARDLESASDLMLILIFIITFLGFCFGFFYLYHVPCPACGAKTRTIKNKKADMWQAYCARCDITWSLGIGIDTGP